MSKRKPEWDLKAERELWAAICSPNGLEDDGGNAYTHEDALWWFVHIAWGAEWYMRQPGKIRWLVERVHKPYLRWLQGEILEWKASRRAGKLDRWYIAIIIPRGFGKTVTATKCALLWSHLDEPNMCSVIGSEVHPKAKEFLAPIAEVMADTTHKTYAWFTWLYGPWYDPQREWNAGSVTHAYRKNTALTEPSIGTAGTEKGVTGYHPDQYWEDDPLSANKLREGGNWLDMVKEAHDAVHPALQTNGWFAMVLTRYLDEDVAGTALATEGIKTWNGMPPDDARLADKIGKGVWRVWFMQARDAEGEPTLPEVTSKEFLDAYEARKPADFAAQYMNAPGTGEHMPLDKSQIPSLFVARDKFRDIPIEYATIHLDTAFKSEEKQKKGDFNVIGVVFHDMRNNGLVYYDHGLHDKKWRVEQFNDKLIEVLRNLASRRIRVRAIIDEVEPGGKRGSWKLLMQKTVEGAGLRCPEIIQLPRQGTKKIERIKAAAGFWVEGWMRLVCEYDEKAPPHPTWKAWHPERTPGLEMLIEQMLKIGVSAHDDMADACADVFIDQVWRRPQFGTGFSASDEGDLIVQPGDSDLKDMSKRISNEQAAQMAKTWEEMHGDEEFDYLPPRY